MNNYYEQYAVKIYVTMSRREFYRNVGVICGYQHQGARV